MHPPQSIFESMSLRESYTEDENSEQSNDCDCVSHFCFPSAPAYIFFSSSFRPPRNAVLRSSALYVSQYPFPLGMGIPFSPVSVLLMVTFLLAKSARRVFTMQMGELSTAIS